MMEQLEFDWTMTVPDENEDPMEEPYGFFTEGDAAMVQHAINLIQPEDETDDLDVGWFGDDFDDDGEDCE